MYEIEIPEIFLVKECDLCGWDHATIRDCPKPITENDSYDPPLQKGE